MTEIEEIKTWDIEKLWNFISVEPKLDRKVYQLVRYGNGVTIDVHDYILNNYTINNKRGIIRYRGKIYCLEDLYTDIENRRRTAFAWIEKNFPDKRVVMPRMMPKDLSDKGE